ncbi:glyceraldehyde-3-phosphate dehydrogenase [Effusibacillus lacus]|uniref:Glyceraldehyde-3-phosphate dehydrogenase n=1 Tax=Effusibacillus lacus TaxID=1348429 RepID=A0A292YR09_9BACL|nr:glyceraldehyde-3-phosphate dehydrogenase [Effusibacillus lacus]TCS68039.1 glyceraldehyde-3-phosphate dehydrogenase (NAD+) [Effusibacillus lacus]GAX90935.1 glyceraldehyde-3-phosphate dehydrogenase [Effusibacillus lacus]
MTIKLGINGTGRIGRMVFRIAMDDPDFDLVAVNTTTDPASLAHLLKYDSVHGRWDVEIEEEENALIVNGRKIHIMSDRDPNNLKWGEYGTDIVIESTGKFRTRETAGIHIQNGARKVIITAPGKDEDATIVMGVNEEMYDPQHHHVLSNASCTTNCLAPVAKVLHQEFGIEQGLMTTVHSYTNDQKNLDNPHKDLRRARACATSIIPTSTGAARAVGIVLPELKGKLNGLALRVPTPNVSIVDLVVTLQKEVTVDKVNAALKKAAAGSLKGILSFTEEPLVSVDFVGNSASSIVDGLSTMVVGERTVKVLAWYDNEWGYSCRVVDLARLVGSKLHERQTVMSGN